MLTASPDLRRYLTGFASSFGFVYTDAQESVFFTDPRYAEGARAALKDAFIAVEVAQSEETVLDYIKSKKIKTLAVPMERVSLPQYAALKKRRFKLTDSMPALEDRMCFKTEEEIGHIAKACGIAERAFADLLGQLKEGMTENETAGLLEYLMRKHGAEDRSFETIVAFGKNTSVPHHASGEDKLKKGSAVLIDFDFRDTVTGSTRSAVITGRTGRTVFTVSADNKTEVLLFAVAPSDNQVPCVIDGYGRNAPCIPRAAHQADCQADRTYNDEQQHYQLAKLCFRFLKHCLLSLKIFIIFLFRMLWVY